MEIFAVSCLTILFLVFQHLINWVIRAVDNRDIDSPTAIILCIILGLLSTFTGKYIILWTYPLIT